MGRGPGKQQRQLLEMVERFPDGFYLASLATSTTHNKSLHRAMLSLAGKGKLRFAKYHMSMFHCTIHGELTWLYASSRPVGGDKQIGGPKLVVYSYGLPQDKQATRDELERRYYEIRESLTVEAGGKLSTDFNT